MAKIQIKELYSELQERFNLSEQETEQFVTAFFAIIKEGVERDGLVKVKGLGTFKITTVDARESINVNTGERIVIDEHDKISFTPDNTMKELVNHPFSLFETVILNDGVNFDDEEEPQPLEEEEVAEPQPVLEDNTAEQELVEPEEILQLVEDEEVTEPQPVETEELLQLVDEEGVTEPQPVETEEILQLVDEEDVTEPQPVLEDNTAGQEPIEPEEILQLVEDEEDTEPHPDVTGEEPQHVESEEELQPVVEEETAESQPVAAEEPHHLISKEEQEDYYDDDEFPEERSNWWKWLCAAVLLILVCGLGYLYFNGYFDQARVKLVAESVEVVSTDSLQPDSTKKAVESSADTKSNAQSDSEKLTYTVTNPVKYGLLTKEEKESIKKAAVKYEEKDQRLRTGGYYIRGLDFEEKVRQGDDLKRIARRTIGEELICYLAVYNNLHETDTLRPGQKIRIPKLIMKKRVQG